MRVSCVLAARGAVVAAVLSAAVVGSTVPSRAHDRGTAECKPETGFGPTNPSWYVCLEYHSAGLGDECVRWGVRPFGSGAEGRFC